MSGKDKREVEWNYASILLVILGVGIALLAIGSYFVASHYIRTLAFMRMFPLHMHRFHPAQPLTNSTMTNSTLTNSTATMHWRNFAMQHHHYFAVRRFGARIPFLFTIYQTLIAIAGLAVAAIGLSSLRKAEKR
ncbi:MAG: hypothetical protein WB661_01910 [Candidatus Bathyarchaeia archaeon]